MSTTTTLSHVLDTWANQDRPADNFGKGDRLQMDGTTNHVRQGFVFFGSLPRPGVYVISATLKLRAKGSWTSRTLTVKRITTPWKERTLTWRNRPTTVTTHQATPTTGALADGDLLSVDVTDIMRDVLLGNGAPFYGFSLGVSGSSTVAFRSSEVTNPNYRPQLDITYVQTPAAAYDLVPGNLDVISVAKPVMRWTYVDVDGEEQGQFDVQIDAAGDFTPADFDTGWVTSTDPQYDVASGAFAGWSADATLYWAVKVADDTGQLSDWSDAVAVTRKTKGTLVLEAPGGTVEEATPLITTNLTGRDQRAIEYLLEEWDSVGSAWRQVWHQPFMPATAASGVDYSFRVPLKVVTGREGRTRSRSPISKRDTDYRITVFSWDTIDGRVATSGDPTYTTVQQIFQWNDSVSGPSVPTDLIAVEEPGSPGVVLTWHRAAVPDEWILLVDGESEAQAPASDWQEP